MILFALVSLALAAEPLVDVTAVVPDVVVDLRYATSDNFMKKQVYPSDARCLLLSRSASQLQKAANVLREKGYRLKVYDCYRPHSVQWELWKIMPKPGYVADPRTGSNHNRGGAVDLTLATSDGGIVEMPSGYDFFGPAAHHTFTGASAAALANRALLRSTMEDAGFTKNPMEWWHYDVPGASKYPLRDEPFTTKRCPVTDAILAETATIAADQRREYLAQWLAEQHVEPGTCSAALDSVSPAEVTVTQGELRLRWQTLSPNEPNCFKTAHASFAGNTESPITLKTPFCFALPREIRLEDVDFDGRLDVRLVGSLSPSHSRRFDEIWLQKKAVTRSERLSSLDDVEVDAATKTLTSRELDAKHQSSRVTWRWVDGTLTRK